MTFPTTAVLRAQPSPEALRIRFSCGSRMVHILAWEWLSWAMGEGCLLEKAKEKIACVRIQAKLPLVRKQAFFKVKRKRPSNPNGVVPSRR